MHGQQRPFAMARAGFSLIEIMLVVIIIGVLVAMVVPNIAGRGEQARKTAAHTDIESNISTSLDLYHMDTGTYPNSEQGLQALIAAPSSGPSNWNGPYLKKKKVPKDPWGRAYVYAFPGKSNANGFDLSSLGPDGVESTDDITNWKE